MHCNKCDSKLNSIIMLMTIVILGACVFGSFLKHYSNLKLETYTLKQELEQCRKQLSEYNERLKYQINLVNDFRHENSILTNDIINLTNKLDEFTTNPISWIMNNYKSYNLEVTAYSPTIDQCDSTPFIAASGQYVDDWTIAVSQNMRKDGWGFGKFVYIPDHNKFYKINDVMNKRFTKRVDIFMWDRGDAHNFGFCDLDMYLIN